MFAVGALLGRPRRGTSTLLLGPAGSRQVAVAAQLSCAARGGSTPPPISSMKGPNHLSGLPDSARMRGFDYGLISVQQVDPGRAVAALRSLCTPLVDQQGARCGHRTV